MKVLLYCNILC